MIGGLDIAPRPVDGFLTEMEGGSWKVEARGVTVGIYADEALARVMLAEHGDVPQWLVRWDGTFELIKR